MAVSLLVCLPNWFHKASSQVSYGIWNHMPAYQRDQMSVNTMVPREHTATSLFKTILMAWILLWYIDMTCDDDLFQQGLYKKNADLGCHLSSGSYKARHNNSGWIATQLPINTKTTSAARRIVFSLSKTVQKWLCHQGDTKHVKGSFFNPPLSCILAKFTIYLAAWTHRTCHVFDQSCF